MTPMKIVRISPPFNRSSLEGVFAAGGICTGGGAPSQIQAELYSDILSCEWH
ncbi:hypothetical protein F5B22DRAFT_613405 [Xylaria bambusicola]|uniref:uncharacterized protein n=1 Tax=Xylaria bambusicola TaxID=326684 RepID=UPI0020073600|nr:uncharacterized protein F5B22DRAFT_613405 [Xylaria bambusicola]KAI0513083.1 hypothetical protein F5B22DRAFT_613405 [Xylaria bambusicola]